MGKGDKKTRKGKIFLSSYGKVRPRKKGSTYKAEKTGEEKKEAQRKSLFSQIGFISRITA